MRRSLVGSLPSRVRFSAVCALVLACGVATADDLQGPVTVHLKSGGEIEGTVIARHRGALIIENASGSRMRIPEETVLRIDGQAVEGPRPTPTLAPGQVMFEVLEGPPTPPPTPTMVPKAYRFWLTDGMQHRLTVVQVTEDAFVLDSQIKIPKIIVARYQPEGEELVVLRPFMTGGAHEEVGLTTTAGADDAQATTVAAGDARLHQAPVGRVQAAVGQVGLLLQENRVQPLKAGDLIRRGDTLVTAEGRAKIFFENGTDFRLRQESVTQFLDSNNVSVKEGKIWAKVKSTASASTQLQVTTPNSIAGVRGTLLSVEVEGPGRVRVAVFEGVVSVQWLTNTRVADEVADGKAVTVGAAGLSPAAPVDPSEIAEWQFWDKWEAEVARLARGFMVGGQIIEAMGKQIASEQKLYEEMVGETNELIRLQKTKEDMLQIWSAIARYRADVQQWPPSDDPWTALFAPSPGGAWRGPYLPPGINDKWRASPFKDHWRQAYTFEVLGPDDAQLVSSGPNKRYENGQGDDLVQPER